MKTYIFLNSPNPHKEIYRDHLSRTREVGDRIICVNGGFLMARSLGVRPDYVIGDLDSLEGEMTTDGFEVVQYPKEKDFSDFELGLQKAIEMKTDKIFVYGALGGRKDHEIVNIVVMAHSGANVVFFERETEVHNVIDEMKLSVAKGCVCSLVSLGEPCLVSEMKGFKYLLKNEPLEPCSRGLSNIARDKEIYVKIKEGNLILIVNK